MSPESTPSHDRPKAPSRSKPHRDFPLTRHPRGYWCKKVKGKLHYFGKIQSDPKGEAALAEWLRVKDELLAGRKPRSKQTGVTVKDVGNSFLNAKRQALEAGEITARTHAEYVATCERVATAFDKSRLVEDLGAEDFESLRASIAKTWGPVRLSGEVQRVRTIFKYAYEAGLIERPVRFGPSFKKPSKRVLRVEKAKRPARMFEVGEIRQLLAAATVQMKAMILLGCNAGFGNHDVAGLPLAAVDLTTGWLSFPRPKTGIARRCPLWPETCQALQAAIASRLTPKTSEAQDLVFVTRCGKQWGNGLNSNPISSEFHKLLVSLGLHKAGRGFYSLRHVFETIGGRSKDQTAVDHIMGHVDGTMAGAYREGIDDGRLQAVSETVRSWLFGETTSGTTTSVASQAGQQPPADDPFAVAIERCRKAIQDATGPTRRTLESVWLRELQLAGEGEAGAMTRLMEVWGDGS
ncbi:MAG: site-specific integrase [Planctomycetota bacterium]|nr:site-specific integrase [Planctomycetota bacterium]